MSRFFKTQQRESGPFKKSQNILTVDLDDIGVTDFSASYLDFELMFKSAAANNPYLTGNVTLGNPATKAAYSGAAMIKNIRLESDAKGLVEECRYQNRHSETMRKFLLTEQEFESSQIRGENMIKLDPITNRGHVHVPLSSVLGCGSSVFPNSAMGMSHIKMELEEVVPWAYKEDTMGVLIAAGSMTFANTAAPANTNQITTVRTFRSLAEAQYYFQVGKTYTIQLTAATAPANNAPVKITAVTCAGTPAAPAVATVTLDTTITGAAAVTAITLQITEAAGGAAACANIAHGAAANPVSTVTVTGGVAIDGVTPWLLNEYYYVGWRVGNACSVSYVKLVAKTDNAADLNLTFEKVIFTVDTANDVGSIFVSKTQIAAVADFEVYSCQLVSAKPMAAKVASPFTFETYVLEMVNMPAVTDFRRQVEVDPSCDQVKLIMPLNNSLLSTRDTVTSYRNAIQSMDTTTMDVTIDNTVNGTLYYDRLINNLDGVKSLQPYNGTEEVVVIAERIPEPQPGINNVVEFRLNASTALTPKSAYFYKRIVKSF